jgi:hypothetical protein
MFDSNFIESHSMNPNARRQIKDIQVSAERLINGRPTIDDIEEFDQYNDELKNYLIGTLTEPELVDRAKQIPKILEEANSQVAIRGILSAFIAMFASGFVTYFQERHRIENSKDAIREASGIYASIEFFTRNAR